MRTIAGTMHHLNMALMLAKFEYCISQQRQKTNTQSPSFISPAMAGVALVLMYFWSEDFLSGPSTLATKLVATPTGLKWLAFGLCRKRRWKHIAYFREALGS